jgi:hypothetical protein
MTIGGLKELIRLHERSDQFNRILRHGQQALEDCFSLEHYEIEDKTSLSVDLEVDLYISAGPVQRYPVTVRLDATVQTLKYIIWSLVDATVLGQDLVLNGRRLRDHWKLGAYPLLGNTECDVQVTLRGGTWSNIKLCEMSAHWYV